MRSEKYKELIDRNIGLINESQQATLKNSTVAVFGLGGLGGVISEILCRSGIGSLKIIDNDRFEPTNLNRQIFCFRDTLRKPKTTVTEKFLKRINPEIKIEKFTEITQDNVRQILKNAAVAVLAIDSAKPCIIISRAARELGIPLVEGWALPLGNVRVLTKNTPSLEEIYNLSTQHKDIDSIPQEEFANLKISMLQSLKKIEGIEEFYPPYAIERIKNGQIPSFAPLVWLTAVLMSLETLKVILNWGKISTAPRFSLYNPFDNTIPKQEV